MSSEKVSSPGDSLTYSKATDARTSKESEVVEETPELRDRTLKELKNFIRKEETLNSRTDDQFLLRFLRARSWNCERAFTLLKNYYGLRLNFPEVFSKTRPSEVVEAIENNIQIILPQRDQHGRAVFLVQLGNWDTNLCKVTDLLRAVEFCFEIMIKSEAVQKAGLVVIVNYHNFGYRHFKEVRFAHLKLYAALIQNSFPARFKEFHIVNEQYFFYILYLIISPLLSKKIKERLHFHGSNLQSLHKFINPDILPKELGGSQPALENSSFVQNLISYDNDFAEDAKYGYKEKPRKK